MDENVLHPRKRYLVLITMFLIQGHNSSTKIKKCIGLRPRTHFSGCVVGEGSPRCVFHFQVGSAPLLRLATLHFRCPLGAPSAGSRGREVTGRASPLAVQTDKQHGVTYPRKTEFRPRESLPITRFLISHLNTLLATFLGARNAAI